MGSSDRKQVLAELQTAAGTAFPAPEPIVAKLVEHAALFAEDDRVGREFRMLLGRAVGYVWRRDWADPALGLVAHLHLAEHSFDDDDQRVYQLLCALRLDPSDDEILDQILEVMIDREDSHADRGANLQSVGRDAAEGERRRHLELLHGFAHYLTCLQCYGVDESAKHAGEEGLERAARSAGQDEYERARARIRGFTTTEMPAFERWD